MYYNIPKSWAPRRVASGNRECSRPAIAKSAISFACRLSTLVFAAFGLIKADQAVQFRPEMAIGASNVQNNLFQPLGGSSTLSATYQGFNPATSSLDLPQNITYQMPDATKFGLGPYPVFLWIPASFESNTDTLSMLFVNQMSARGFLAASVQYSNTEAAQFCSTYSDRAKGIFEAGRSTSALNVVCNQAGASCSKGIVVSGFSQGAILAVMAANYSSSVKAAYAMAMSAFNKNGGGIDLSSCVNKQFTKISSEHLMVITGQSDPLFGGQVPLQNVSGYVCPPETSQCWSPTGSGGGWYSVPDTEVADGAAGHCYFMTALSGGDCPGSYYDRNWYTGTLNWSLRTNLDWLSTFGTKRIFSASGH